MCRQITIRYHCAICEIPTGLDIKAEKCYKNGKKAKCDDPLSDEKVEPHRIDAVEHRVKSCPACSAVPNPEKSVDKPNVKLVHREYRGGWKDDNQERAIHPGIKEESPRRGRSEQKQAKKSVGFPKVDQTSSGNRDALADHENREAIFRWIETAWRRQGRRGQQTTKAPSTKKDATRRTQSCDANIPPTERRRGPRHIPKWLIYLTSTPIPQRTARSALAVRKPEPTGTEPYDRKVSDLKKGTP